RRGGEQEAGRAAGARRRGRGRAAPRAPPRPRGPADADAIRLRTAAGATAGRIPVTLIQRRAGHHIIWAAGAARLTARRCALRKTRSGRALSSAGERSLHTGEVVGSIPTAPTRKSFCLNKFALRVSGGSQRFAPERNEKPRTGTAEKLRKTYIVCSRSKWPCAT